jgi:flagellar basal body L-ring protein FlgH
LKTDSKIPIIFNKKWNKYLDYYLKFSDFFHDRFENSEFVSAKSNSVFKVTIFLLLFVFILLLFSCEHNYVKENLNKETSYKETNENKKIQKIVEPIYVKKKSLVLKNIEDKSGTGSIWADTKKPRELFSTDKPKKTGELVTVLIPEDLQFKWPGAKKPADEKQAGEGVGEIGNEIEKETITKLNMQIIAFDNTGDVFLKANRNFKTSNGEFQNQTIIAKIPASKVNGFEISAKDISEVSISTEGTPNNTGNDNEYASTGWDKNVSRILSGYRPDIDSSLQALEKVKEEVAMSQKNLKDSRKTIEEERERLFKDRQRIEKDYETRLDRVKKGLNLSEPQTQQSQQSQQSQKTQQPQPAQPSQPQPAPSNQSNR